MEHDVGFEWLFRPCNLFDSGSTAYLPSLLYLGYGVHCVCTCVLKYTHQVHAAIARQILSMECVKVYMRAIFQCGDRHTYFHVHISLCACMLVYDSCCCFSIYTKGAYRLILCNMCKDRWRYIGRVFGIRIPRFLLCALGKSNWCMCLDVYVSVFRSACMHACMPACLYVCMYIQICTWV